jgi:predicted transcriptional regulator
MEQQWFNGLTLVGAGWVLQAAAAQSRRRAKTRRTLQPVKVGNVMTQECPFVSSHTTVSQLIHDHILTSGQSYFLIVKNDRLEGTVTMENVKRVPKKHRGSHLHTIMKPASEIRVAYPQQSPIVEDDKVLGMVTRESLLRLAQTRRELKL